MFTSKQWEWPAPRSAPAKSGKVYFFKGTYLFWIAARLTTLELYILFFARTGLQMAYQGHPLTSSLRHPSMGGSQASSAPSPMLVARINEKKTELESLKQLRDLSAGLAMQMQTLEEKISTLSDGTEGQRFTLSRNAILTSCVLQL